MNIYIVIKDNHIDAYKNMRNVCESTGISYNTLTKWNWDEGGFAYQGCLILKKELK